MRKWISLVTVVFLLTVVMTAAGGCGQQDFRDNGYTNGNDEPVHSGHEDGSEGRLIVDELENEIKELLDLLELLEDFDESELDF